MFSRSIPLIILTEANFARIYQNKILAASDFFGMFTESIKVS